jgi:hypothetical protein
MKLKLTAYEKLIQVIVIEKLNEEELNQLLAQSLEWIGAGQIVLVRFKSGTIDEQNLNRFIQKRAEKKLKKQQFVLVHSKLSGADSKTIADGLLLMNTVESGYARDINLLSKQELKIKKESTEIDQLLSNMLRKALGLADSSQSLSDIEVEKMQYKVKNNTRKIKYLYDLLGKELLSAKRAGEEFSASIQEGDAQGKLYEKVLEAAKKQGFK